MEEGVSRGVCMCIVHAKSLSFVIVFILNVSALQMYYVKCAVIHKYC